MYLYRDRTHLLPGLCRYLHDVFFQYLLIDVVETSSEIGVDYLEVLLLIYMMSFFNIYLSMWWKHHPR